MTILSFVSASKYILGLLLVMLGFIPYDALEGTDTAQKTRNDTMCRVNTCDHVYDTVSYCYEFLYVVPEVDFQHPAVCPADSGTYPGVVVIMKPASDTLAFFVSR